MQKTKTSMKKWQAWRWQSQTGLKILSILSFSFMTRFIVNDKFYFNSLWLFLILFSLVLYSASMINCMYMHLELLYSKNKTKNKNNRVTDDQSTCLQNLLLTHLVYVIKVSRIILKVLLRYASSFRNCPSLTSFSCSFIRICKVLYQRTDKIQPHRL